MLDIKFVRENPDVVKQNIKNKFQESKLELVDEVIELDQKNRDIKNELQSLQANRNKLSKQIGALMGQGKKEEAEEVKKQVTAQEAVTVITVSRNPFCPSYSPGKRYPATIRIVNTSPMQLISPRFFPISTTRSRNAAAMNQIPLLRS